MNFSSQAISEIKQKLVSEISALHLQYLGYLAIFTIQVFKKFVETYLEAAEASYLLWSLHALLIHSKTDTVFPSLPISRYRLGCK